MKYPKSVLVSAAAILTVIAGPTTKADYSNTLMSLSPQPVAYWPLQETVVPPTCYATNLGTLGTAANGQYGMWWQSLNTTNYYFTNTIAHVAGATADDADTARRLVETPPCGVAPWANTWSGRGLIRG